MSKSELLAKKPQNDRHLKNPKIRDKYMVVGPPKPDYHTFVSYFRNVDHSAALKLGCVPNFHMVFLVLGFVSLIDEIQFMLNGGRHICIRSIYLFFLLGEKFFKKF